MLPRRPHLGLDLAVVDASEGGGLVVMDHGPTSPLRDLVRVGECLHSLDGVPVRTPHALRERLRSLRVGTHCTLDLGERELGLTLPALPTEDIPDADVQLGEVEVGGYRLRTLFTRPNKQGPFPTVWLLPSASWVSQEHVQQPWHPSAALIRELSRLGVATWRVERAGLGDSEGAHCTTQDLTTELKWWRAALPALLRNPEVDRSHWMLFGRSLGGIVAQLLAADFEPSTLGIWGSTARPWSEAMLGLVARQRRLMGDGDAEVERYLVLRAQLGEAVYGQGKRPGDVLAQQPALAEVRGDAKEDLIHDRHHTFFHQLEHARVAQHCAAFGGDVLLMRGSLDWLTSTEDADSIEQVARSSQRLDFESIDHLMCRRNNLREAFEKILAGSFDSAGANAMAQALLK